MCLVGYMYDRLNKNSYSENKYKDGIWDRTRMIFFIQFKPLKFLKYTKNRRNA
jgi:hypothetical protein